MRILLFFFNVIIKFFLFWVHNSHWSTEDQKGFLFDAHACVFVVNVFCSPVTISASQVLLLSYIASHINVILMDHLKNW